MTPDAFQLCSLVLAGIGSVMFCVGTFRDLNRPITVMDVLRKYA